MKTICKRIIIVLFAVMMFLPGVEAKTYSKNVCKQYARDLVIKKYHWTVNDYNNLVKLWNKESGWNAKAYNRRSGSCGIAQATPCKKMRKYGRDYKTNCKVQINWGLDYIKRRYKNPTKAWRHFEQRRWY